MTFKHYLGIIISFLDDNFEVHDYCLGCVVIPSIASSENIKDILN